MDCYLLNTDAKSMADGKSPHEKWFHYGVAFCAEHTKYKSELDYGRNFEKLMPGDTCLMYANGIGIVGAGEVLEKYNGKTYPEPESLVYGPGSDGFGKEHRIKVDWKDLRNTPNGPISNKKFRSITGIIPKMAFFLIREARAQAILKLIYH